MREDRLLVPPNSERVAELPDTPGGATSITRQVPHTYIGVFLRVFKGSPQLVLTAMGELKNNGQQPGKSFVLTTVRKVKHINALHLYIAERDRAAPYVGVC